MTLGIPVTPTHQAPPINVQQLPPLGPHRKTLERNIRNNHHNQLPPIPNGMVDSSKMMIDGELWLISFAFDDVLILGVVTFQVIADWAFQLYEQHPSDDSRCAAPIIQLTTALE